MVSLLKSLVRGLIWQVLSMSCWSVTGTESDNGVYWPCSAYTWMLLFAESFIVCLKFHCLALGFSVGALDRTCTDRDVFPGDLLALWIFVNEGFCYLFLKWLCLESCFITQTGVALSPWRKEHKVFWILQTRKILLLENIGCQCVHLLLQRFTIKMPSKADVCSEKLWPCQICAVFVSIGPSDEQLMCVVCSCLASHCSRSTWQWCVCCGEGPAAPQDGSFDQSPVRFSSLSWTGRDQEMCASVVQLAVFPCRDFTYVCIVWCKQRCSILMPLQVFK